MIIADWRDPQAYPAAESLSLKQWGWEFLRRNPIYQEEWKQVAEKNPEDSAYSSEGEDGEPARWGWVDGNASSIKKWGIGSYYSPHDPYAIEINFDHIPGILRGDDRPNVQDDLGSAEAAIIIDLSMPVKRQLEIITPYVLELQKNTGFLHQHSTNHVRKWPNYLRVLDAKAANVSRAEAASIIYPRVNNPSERWSESLKQAKDLRDKGFLKLILT